MKTLNHLYSTPKRFKSFFEKNGISRDREHFIQVFIGNNDSTYMQETLSAIKIIAPLSSIIATSTAGEIIEGGMQDNTTVVSITTFDDTKVRVKLLEEESEEEMAQKISSTLLKDNTKLILVFNNVFSNDGEIFLQALETRAPNIKIAGGNAGDNGKFSFTTVVGANNKVSTTGIAIALFDSDVLQVFNDYLFNWQTIGEKMTVTKADKSVIYEINNQKAVDIYEDYLGEEVAKSLPMSAIEFPLIFNEDDLDIARAPVAVGDNGELIMAGHIKEGTTVQFGFGDVAQNELSITDTIKNFSTNPIESIFIYSCSARKYFLKNNLNNEFDLLQKIAPTSGFITYGEFFKQKECNKMLNVASTFIGLSENAEITHKVNFDKREASQNERTLHALTHLVKKTSQHLSEKNTNLTQFQHLIREATIYSTTDTRGIITDVNKLFMDMSGYSRDELIGKNHNIVRHNDMPKSTYVDMWDTIKQKQSWSGIIKNRAKDGSEYYVRSNIFPILDTNGNIVQYLSLRDDITEEMQRKNYLEGSVGMLESKTEETEYLLAQYENVINHNSSFFRIDPEFNMLHVNDVFCEIYHCSPQKMQKKRLNEILEANFMKESFESINASLMQHGIWSGTVPFEREDKSIIYMNTSANTIYDKEENLIEIMVVMNDITDLVIAQKEIEDTQRDVVYTMGAIGETRSKETGNHVKRVAEYSRILAVHYGLSNEEAKLLKMASPMHDIGKVGIPDSVLNKPGKLDKDEWIIMQTHSEIGYSMLKHSNRKILQAAAIVAHTHHEKFDGSGYPQGTRGEDIHIYGRITAIADVFDALGSDRCYKKAWDDEKIFKLLREESGTHFDPTLIEIFFENLDSFLAVRDEFQD